jgi:pyruvate dehydrogenase E2 component (dihydrolipoamide acetyltransferase)
LATSRSAEKNANKGFNVTIQTVVVPDLGGAETVEVIELGLAPGDNVEVEDSLLVLESDKATMDIPSPATGVFTKYLVEEGATVSIGDPIAEIEVADEAVATEEAAVVEESAAAEPAQEAAPAAPVASTPAAASELMVQVPDVGNDDKVDVIEVCVAVGDEVSEGDTLIVLESDKATMDIPSTHSGTVLKIVVAEGDKLGTGDDVALFEVTTSVDQAPAEQTSAEPAPQAAPVVEAAPAAAAPAPVQEQSTQASTDENTAGADVYAGPAVRLLARELGVDLTQVSGTGPKGRIQKDDVSNFVKKVMKNKDSAAAPTATGGAGIPPIPAVDFSQFGEIEEIKLSKIQKLTAANMQRNWLNIPHVTQFDDADITELEDFRKGLKAEGEKRGVRVTPVAFLIKALGATLEANPAFNRSMGADGETIIQKHYCNVGMAVDTPRGLVVPVIRDVNEKGIWEISADIMDLAAKARDGKLKPAEMQGGCFTLSSLGAIGGNGFTPIVNAPEVGILGVSKSQIKPVWNGTEFAPRLLLPMALSYDHRAINGGDAGRFMTHLVKLLSDIRHLAL